MLSKKRLKKAAISVLTVIATLCMCFAAGCNKPEEKITLLDEADRPSAVVSREFDAMSIVSDTNGYELELTECFYLDGNMQRVNIEVYDGTKFVPTVEKEVMLTLKIKGGTFIKETTIKVEAPVSAIQEEFMGSWNDEGVGKTVTAQSEYLTEGAESVIKVKYMGSLGSTVSGPGIGGFYYNSRDVLPFSVTDWSNAVMVMDIYNPMDVNLVIYYCIIKDSGTWTSEITGQYGQQRYALLEAGTWTKAVLSLNMLGIDYNMYEKYNGYMYIAFRASFETMPEVKPFEWTMYIANMDITDYSKERFPDLQTKRPDQILDEMDGDADDKETYKHLLEENSDFRYANIKTEAKIVSYEAENLTKPNDNSGDYLNKYTVHANKADITEAGAVLYSTPLYYKNAGYYVLTEEQKKIDFSKAFLTFDVYNPNDIDLDFYLVNSLSMYINYSVVKTQATAKSWTKIELSLMYLTVGEAYAFAASLGGIRMDYETLNYYIDNAEIIEKDVPTIEDKAAALTDVENEIATHGSYNFNETNIPTDINGVSWIKVDNKDAKEAEGKKFLQVKVNFEEFSTVSVAFAYSAGAAVYKFSFGYKHGDTTVFAYNNYQGNKTILGSMKFGLPQGSSGLRIYENGVKVVNHGSTVWSYYSTVNNYSSASGNMSTGTDYIFEFELEKCAGDMRICFGASSVIKSVEWKETDGVSGGGSGEDPEVPVGDDLAKNTLKHLLPENTDFRYAGIVTEGNIVTYKKENLTKPNEEASEFVNKYTIKANKEDTTAGGPVLYSAPLYYSNQGKYALTEEEKALDFATGEIRFDFYNPNSFNIDIYIANSLSAYITGFPRATAKANSWTKIALPLSGVSVGEEYSFAVSVGGNRMEYKTLTYYIDNVEFGEKPADTTVTLSAAETEIATHGSYTFNATNNPVDENGVSWIRVDNKKEKETEGKKFLQVKVSFTEFSTVSAGFAYTAGAATYKFSFGYVHGNTTVIVYKNYQNTKAIFGTMKSGQPQGTSGLRIYQGDLKVADHGSTVWSYYSTAGNYASANGNFSAGVDYVFEYDLTKCAGELKLNFGSSSEIKSVEWKETSGVTPVDPGTETNNTLSYVESQISANGKYDFNATNNPVDENGVSWIKVDNKAAKEAEGKKTLQVKVSFTEFSTVSAGFAYTAGAAVYKFSFGYKHGDTTVIVYNNYQNTKAIFGTMKSGQPQGTSGLRIYQGDLKVADHGSTVWSYYSTAGNYASANGNFSAGVDYVFEYDLTKCAGELKLNFGSSSVIKSVEWK